LHRLSYITVWHYGRIPINKSWMLPHEKPFINRTSNNTIIKRKGTKKTNNGSYWLSWSHHFKSFTVATTTWLNRYRIAVSKTTKSPLICFICRKHVSTSRSFPHSWLINGFVTRITRRVSLVEQELLTLPEHMSSPMVVSGVCVARSLDLCIVSCRSLFVLLFFFCWQLCCLFFDLRILITPSVSLISSFTILQ